MLSIHQDTPPPCSDRFNMAEYVMQVGRSTPQRTALEVIGSPGEVLERWSFAQLDATIAAVAGGLAAQGLQPGQRVGLRLGNTMDFPLVFFGAQRLGAVPIAISSQLGVKELGPLLALTRPDMIVRDPALDLPQTNAVVVDDLAALRDHAPAPLFDTAADDPAYIVFTSGSSGTAKAVVHAHRAAHARRMMWPGWYELEPTDRVLHAGAFNWTFTLGTGLTDPWAAGAQALIHVGEAGPDTHRALIAAHRPTLFAAVPGIFRRILKSNADLKSAFQGLRHALCAGETLPASLRAEWRDRTGTELHEAFGMSEISTFISSSPSRPAPVGTIGWVQDGRQVAVLGADQPVPRGTPGELSVHRSEPGLMLGYLNGEPLPEWFRTGDQVVMEESGAVRYLGRLDDLMTANGYRVSPVEVEAAMLTCAGVREVGVCEVSPKPGVRIIAAFYTGDADPAEVMAELAGSLATYKMPKHIQPIPDLPRGPTGKVKRSALPDLYIAEERS